VICVYVIFEFIDLSESTVICENVTSRVISRHVRTLLDELYS
jgi:hypothetical protein